MIKMVAFDFDGTVGDTAELCLDVFRKAVSPYVSHPVTDEEIFETYGLNETGMLKKIVGGSWTAAETDLREFYSAGLESCSGPFPGVPELIAYLNAKKIRTALITGKGNWSCTVTLKKFNLEQAFCDIETGREDRPDKAGAMRKLITKYHLTQNEFVYIGDAVSDITASRKAGVRCLSAAWSSMSDISALQKENPGMVFSNLSAVKNYFMSEQLP